jgi:hypothetical protein
VITDEKMARSISMSQTTLYDEISYSGAPSSFAWVLPIKGTVTVGLSADVMFQVLNQLTATEVVEPPTNCPPAPVCNQGGGSVALAGAAATDGESSSDGVTVTSQKQVGPYETVQLHSSDGSALTSWLTQHGYQIPSTTVPIIDAYVTQGFDFLALKLVPGAGVQSMQPVRVTSQGAAPSLPLHMVAVGTGATTGITIWVVADGRWAPSNFPTFTIADREIAWDWATSSSNYESVRTAKEAALGGRGWQIESSLALSEYSFAQSLIGNVQYGGQAGGYLAASGDAGAPDARAVDGGEVGFDAGYDAGEAVNAEVAAAEADLAVLFNGIAQPNVRITRMRSDVAKSALSVDMQLEASADQSELTNVHTPGSQIGEPTCAVYSEDGCSVVGEAPRSVALADGAALSGGGGCNTTKPSGSRTTTLGLVSLAGLLAFAATTKRRGSRRR